MGFELRTNLTAQPMHAAVDPALAEMFGAKRDGVVQLDVNWLKPYPNQPFKLYSDAKMFDLCESVTHMGIINPIIVRAIDEAFYQILSGHNRWNAGKLIGMKTVPCIVVDVNDEDAVWIVTTSNLQQREGLLPSEKAWAYRLQLDAGNRQGARSDLTSSNDWTKFGRSDQELSERIQKSRSTIQLYARLTCLVPELMDKVDKGQVKVAAAYCLAGLQEDQQKDLVDFMQNYKIDRITPEQAKLIVMHKGRMQESDLRDDFNLFAGEQPKRPSVTVRIPKAYLPSKHRKLAPDDELLQRIAGVIEQYYTEKGT